MGRLTITEDGEGREVRTSVAEDLELVITYGENGVRACYGTLYLLLREPQGVRKLLLASASLPAVDGQNKAIISRLRAMLFVVCSDQLTHLAQEERHP